MKYSQMFFLIGMGWIMLFTTLKDYTYLINALMSLLAFTFMYYLENRQERLEKSINRIQFDIINKRLEDISNILYKNL